jgi:hypothetical protein
VPLNPCNLSGTPQSDLVFNLPKISHVIPLHPTLHWLPVEARINYKTMVLAYGAARGTAPPYLQAMFKPYTSGLLALPYGRASPAQPSQSYSLSWYTNGGIAEARTAESLPIFRKHLKPYLFKEYLK